MRLSCYTLIETFEDKPKFGIDWVYYNSSKHKDVLTKRNKYRSSMGLPVILDNGQYLNITINFGQRLFCLAWRIRPVKYADHR